MFIGVTIFSPCHPLLITLFFFWNMASNENGSWNHTPMIDIDTQEFYFTQFWIFLFLTIQSIICSLFGLYHFLLTGTLRQALSNHIIIFLLLIALFYDFTDMSWYINYFRTPTTFSSTPAFRLAWGYIDWTFFTLHIILYAWATVERHILIFHDQLLSTRKKRFFVHYLPPVVITIYCLLYYSIVFFVVQCTNDFNNIITPLFVPCAYQNNSLFMYETIVHAILTVLTIVISSVALLLRVLWQRHRTHRQIDWRRHRKMTIQLLSISIVYIIFLFPYALITICQLCGLSTDAVVQVLSVMTFFTYYALFLVPIACISLLPELRNKLMKILQLRQQQRAIHPIMLPMVRMRNDQVVIQ
jgi:hypothetical protein